MEEVPGGEKNKIIELIKDENKAKESTLNGLLRVYSELTNMDLVRCYLGEEEFERLYQARQTLHEIKEKLRNLEFTEDRVKEKVKKYGPTLIIY